MEKENEKSEKSLKEEFMNGNGFWQKILFLGLILKDKR